MFGYFRTIIAVLQGLLEAWRAWRAYVESERLRKASERRQAREKASADVQSAQTEEQFDEASDRLHDNSSKP